MKRLKIPRIPTRIPLPNLPSFRRSSQKAKDNSDISVTLPPEAEESPDVKSVDQTKEANEVEHRKVNVPKIPLPSISKPSMPKLHVPKIPLPSISKPGVPKLSVPKIPLPSVSMPKTSKKIASHKENGELIAEKSDASMATSESDSSKSEQPEAKMRSKFSMPKMPSLHKTKVKPITQEPAVSPMPEHEMAAASTPAPVQKDPESDSSKSEQPETKMRSKFSMPKMPSLHKTKVKPITQEPVGEKGEPKSGLHKNLSMPKMPSLHKTKVKPITQEPVGEKGEPKSGLHKNLSMPKMPSLHKTKVKPITQEPVVSPMPEHEMAAASTPSPVQKEMPAVSADATPAPQLEETKTAPKTPVVQAKGKSKMNTPLKLPKFSMPSLSLGKGSAKPTGKHIKGSTKSTGKRVLALTLEGTDVRLVSYHNNAIESWKSVSFDARLLKMGQVADPEGLGEVIKNAIAGIETNRCYVVCALPGLRSVSRIITIPNVGKKELDSVVPREVRRTMTVSEEDNYFHWQILPSETEAAQTRVFLLAVPKEPMSLLLRAFSHAGLNPSIIDLKPLALMRAVNQKDAIIANCEGNSMELVIVSDDIPVLIRSVFLGEGVANQDYAIGRISDELGRTIVTYNEINKEHPLNPDIPVYLTGAAAAGVPFALNVAALTGRTVQPLESPIPLPADLPIAQYMVNIGLILKAV